MEDESKKYDAIASQFDQDRDKSLREKYYLDTLVEGLPSDASILDVGCGMGEPIAKYLIECGFKVTGIDASSELLDLAKKRYPVARWIAGDMLTVQLNELFDAVISYDSFFHLTIKNQIKMIERFSLWLKPSGKLLISTGPEEGEVLDSTMHGQKFSYFSMARDDYVKYLNASHLEVLLVEEDQPNHLIWIAKNSHV